MCACIIWVYCSAQYTAITAVYKELNFEVSSFENGIIEIISTHEMDLLDSKYCLHFFLVQKKSFRRDLNDLKLNLNTIL